MMASETQDTVYNWINSTFPGTDPDSPRKSLRLIEEAVELCLVSGATVREILHAVNRAINNDVWHPIDGRDFRPDRIPAEAADVQIVLYGLAGMRGFDLNAAVDKKMKINRGRVWRTLGDGTGYHIKEDQGSIGSSVPGEGGSPP